MYPPQPASRSVSWQWASLTRPAALHREKAHHQRCSGAETESEFPVSRSRLSPRRRRRCLGFFLSLSLCRGAEARRSRSSSMPLSLSLTHLYSGIRAPFRTRRRREEWLMQPRHYLQFAAESAGWCQCQWHRERAPRESGYVGCCCWWCSVGWIEFPAREVKRLHLQQYSACTHARREEREKDVLRLESELGGRPGDYALCAVIVVPGMDRGVQRAWWWLWLLLLVFFFFRLFVRVCLFGRVLL